MGSLDTTIGLFHVFGDATRLRLMALLAREELTVAELTAITELSQSRVSTHLGKLREAGLLRDRRVGSRTLYALSENAMPSAARDLWQLVQSQVSDAVLESDRQRAEQMRARRTGGDWPDAIAGEMERHYSPGRTWEATAHGLLGLVQLGCALDIGSGDGTIAQLLAPRAQALTCLDRSEPMVAAARQRLRTFSHVDVRQGDMHELPWEEAHFDQVLLFNVLTYAHSPERVISETARVLDKGGNTALITLNAHDHVDITSAYGHLQPGFQVGTLRSMLEQAGLTVAHCAVTSRERRKPHFEVITAFATKR